MLADFRPDTNELVIDVAHQNPHALRGAIASLLDHPDDLVTVRCGDIGGSFGQKAYTSREELSLCAAARMLGRPVKWIEDRTENLLAAGHARDDVLDVDARGDERRHHPRGPRQHDREPGCVPADHGATVDLPRPRARALPQRVPHRQLRVRGNGGRFEHGDVHRVPRARGNRRAGRASA